MFRDRKLFSLTCLLYQVSIFEVALTCRRLIVEQQPVRARMCGFGDKDRRPITPPPCIRLIVMHADTGKEVDVKSVSCRPGSIDTDAKISP
jgi:hypothetical protein